MTWIIPLTATAIAYAAACWRTSLLSPALNFGAVDMLRYLATIFYFGVATVVSLIGWIIWLAWMAFS